MGRKHKNRADKQGRSRSAKKERQARDKSPRNKKSPLKYPMRDDLEYGDESAEDFYVLTDRYYLERAFPKPVRREMSRFEDFVMDESVWGEREDLRSQFIITIDGDDAKDFDDAISITMDKGEWMLGVHIADVSFFVRKESETDREAKRRGTSVYLIDKVLPMLPEELSNKLCSLVEGEDRLTFSCEMHIDAEGAIKEYRFFKSVIKSRRRCTYREVQDVLDHKLNLGEELAEKLVLFDRLRKLLYTRRMREGAIDFESSEQKFTLQPDGKVFSIEKKVRLESERLIEECMLAANRCAAAEMLEHNTGIFRVHEAPKTEKIETFTAILHKKGLRLGRGSLNPLEQPGENIYQKFLQSLSDINHRELFSHLLLTSMQQARYGADCLGHYGLAFHEYTHFTSPIRRYPDLLVHRILAQTCSAEGGSMYRKGDLAALGTSSSICERRAVDCEREYYRVKSIRHLTGCEGMEFDTVVTSVTNFGIFVRDMKTAIEGFVDLRKLDAGLVFDEDTSRYVTRSKGEARLEPGMKMRVKLLGCNIRRLFIDFEPV